MIIFLGRSKLKFWKKIYGQMYGESSMICVTSYSIFVSFILWDGGSILQDDADICIYDREPYSG